MEHRLIATQPANLKVREGDVARGYQQRMEDKKISRNAAAVTLVGILAISFLPLHYKYIIHTKGLLHPWGHLASFAIGSALSLNSTRINRLRAGIVLLLLAFACLIEGGEALIFQITFEWADVWVDTLGVMMGIPLSLLLQKLTRR